MDEARQIIPNYDQKIELVKKSHNQVKEREKQRHEQVVDCVNELLNRLRVIK